MGWLGAVMGRKPTLERGQASAALPNIRRSRRPARPADYRQSTLVRARSTHSDLDRFLPDQTCRRIQQGRHLVPIRLESFLPLQRGYLGASTPPLRFMFCDRKRCFSEEAALTGKYRPSKAIASFAVDMPTTCIKLRIS